MSPSLFALTGFAAWTLLLTLLLLNMRGYYSFMSENKVALNQFSPDGNNTPGFGQRLTRAHLNCLEMLPSFGVLVLVAAYSEQLSIMSDTVMYVLYARIAQSIIHMVSTSLVAVLLRATCWVVQLGLLLSYAYQLLAAGL
ncbi:MAG: MAPEG family protein [Bermanella sp.]